MECGLCWDTPQGCIVSLFLMVVVGVGDGGAGVGSAGVGSVGVVALVLIVLVWYWCRWCWSCSWWPCWSHYISGLVIAPRRVWGVRIIVGATVRGKSWSSRRYFDGLAHRSFCVFVFLSRWA